MIRDPLGAFVPGTACVVQATGDGPLAGTTFAAKDLFDVAGHVTGCGNPDWARTHAPAKRHAAAVKALLDAGSTLVGKAITDEISLGLVGRNRFEGTPLNPKAPDRVPGGSSSGSASAVAGGLVDTALGTDSGGSVRTPAAFCGLYGLRPTLGRISCEGMMLQSPTFDTCGWFAADGEMFARVGAVLLGAPIGGPAFSRMIVATDCFAIADEPVRAALAPAVARLAGAFASVVEAPLATGDILEWSAAQSLLQRAEFSATFAPFVEAAVPRFSIEVGTTLALAALIGEADLVGPKAFRAEATARMVDLLGDDGVICLPTTPILPPPRDEPFSALMRSVGRIVELTAIAGLTGHPQVNLPLADHGGIPVGLSLIGPKGSDERLVAFARDFPAA
ncbi:amidase [Oharaeibacter diazotrophicus]|uniref:Amidase n=1 Tax=Oharaeibacter diazotrophicus TaxID=1920512 RepID=A0A4R6R5P1_9HYPH|nr:amidase [Oharaeibacter diazotrophicus]TDP81139.1 amidase [Oharaeibacter diazotrophicus]BBE74868.1 glutamyl-tRNA(Gln) amidotransferase subunit A [Pleomorphomonas sp. SM30]GLS75628.1 amidase [Oharaeibacter diazotrophicus]